MHNIYVKDILEKCHGKLLSGNINLILENFSKDTRTIKKGDIYLGIKGENFDGNLFYEDAIKSGAICCILDHIPSNFNSQKYPNTTIVKVPNTIKCIQELATYKRSLYNIPVVAITGSVGKTSTKDLVYSVLSQKYRTLKSIGNNNNHIGLPLTILRLKNEEALVVELGMNHPKEISKLASIAKPTIAIITNIGISHIGNLGTRENILKAKLEITEYLTSNNYLIINNDNDLLHKEALNLSQKYNLITYGINNKSNYNANNINDNIFSTTFYINNDQININIGTQAFVYNALCAYTTGKALNIPSFQIIKAIKEFKLSPHRLEKINLKNNIIMIDDTYNANKDSMLNALSLLSKVKNKRKIAVIGDILELGEYEKQIHQEIGETIQKNKLDILITVGQNARIIKSAAISKGFPQSNTYSYNNYQEVIDNIDSILKSNDIILLKASHGIHLEKIAEYLAN